MTKESGRPLHSCTHRSSGGIQRARLDPALWQKALRLEDRNHDGCKYCMLNIRDELTRECLAIRIDLKLIASYLVGLSAMH